jgi:catechol 2,3-dioxygenase-like lactoylglutathione lyase family enzyme
MPQIIHLVEAAIYVQDLKRAGEFYEKVLGLEKIGEQEGRHIFFRVGESVLLLFNPESTLKGGHLPAHGTSGPGHFAFGVPNEELGIWRKHLEEKGIEIEREMEWPKGGRSFYFRDPDDNSVELITQGCWGLPSGW